MNQIISHKLVKTRKPHHCWGCAKEFPPKSSLWRCVSKQEEITRTYWCDSCQDVIDEDPDSVESCYFGDFRDCVTEQIGGF